MIIILHINIFLVKKFNSLKNSDFFLNERMEMLIFFIHFPTVYCYVKFQRPEGCCAGGRHIRRGEDDRAAQVD